MGDYDAIVTQVRQQIVASALPVTAHTVRQQLRQLAMVADDDTVNQLTAVLLRQLTGAGPLQNLLDRPDVTDVLVNGPDDIWFDCGQGLQRADMTLGSQQELRSLAMRLAANAHCRLDDACPSADGRLPDGTRLHAMLHPIVEPAAVISLRIPQRQTWQLADLVARQMLPARWLPVLQAITSARISAVISGPTGAGKTTVLAALLSATASNERIVLIEESRELVLTHPHLVALQARRSNAEGTGQVSLTQLVKEALRMRPDRIVVGEVRGEEIRELLLAFNTGHRGGFTTIHANSALDVPNRLTSLGLLAGLNPQVLADQVMSAIGVVIHVTRSMRAGRQRRFVSHLSVVDRANRHADAGPQTSPGLHFRPAARWDGQSEPEQLPGWQALTSAISVASREQQ